MMFKLRFVCLFLSVVCVGLVAGAQGLGLQREQKLGTLELSDLYLEPQFRFVEGGQGNLSLGDSFVQMSWRLSPKISSRVQIGTSQGLYTPFFYGRDESTQPITLRQGFGQWDSDYGTVRAGVIPLTYGLEGGLHPANLYLPDSRIYFNRWTAKNDFGMSYSIAQRRFQVEVQAHNGETTASNVDNQTWMTARWSYIVPEYLRIGISGVNGRTNSRSTSNVARTSDFAPNQDSRIKIGNLFSEIQVNEQWHVASEFHMGSLEQGGDRRPIQGARLDLKYHFASEWGATARIEDFTGNTLNRNGRTLDATIGAIYLSPSKMFNVYAYFTRTEREGMRFPEHQGFLVWKLSPLY